MIIACIVLVLVSGIMLAISLIFKIFPLLVMGIAFLITTIVFFINSQREINKIENELNKKNL